MTELKRHVVQDGETLPAIAKRFGFQSHKPIFNHPANAELKKRRPNPNVLNPGASSCAPPTSATGSSSTERS